MLNITRRDIEEAHQYARDAMTRGSARDYNKKTGESRTVGGVIRQTMGVGIGAFGVGVLTGRLGPLHIGGNPVPVDLVAGLGIHLGTFLASAFFNIEAPKDFNNVADGVLAGYFTKFGVGVGTQLRAKANLPALNLTSIAGTFDSNSSVGAIGGRRPAELQGAPYKGPMTESELAAMAQAVR